MDDRGKWRGRVMEIRASSMAWWRWWYICRVWHVHLPQYIYPLSGENEIRKAAECILRLENLYLLFWNLFVISSCYVGNMMFRIENRYCHGSIILQIQVHRLKETYHNVLEALKVKKICILLDNQLLSRRNKVLANWSYHYYFPKFSCTTQVTF